MEPAKPSRGRPRLQTDDDKLERRREQRRLSWSKNNNGGAKGPEETHPDNDENGEEKEKENEGEEEEAMEWRDKQQIKQNEEGQVGLGASCDCQWEDIQDVEEGTQMEEVMQERRGRPRKSVT